MKLWLQPSHKSSSLTKRTKILKWRFAISDARAHYHHQILQWMTLAAAVVFVFKAEWQCCPSDKFIKIIADNEKFLSSRGVFCCWGMCCTLQITWIVQYCSFFFTVVTWTSECDMHIIHTWKSYWRPSHTKIASALRLFFCISQNGPRSRAHWRWRSLRVATTTEWQRNATCQRARYGQGFSRCGVTDWPP